MMYREIDEAFGDFEMEEEEDTVVEIDETVAIPERYGRCSRNM